MPDLSDRTEKACPRCERLLPVSEFAANRSALDGRQGYCRSCSAELYRLKQQKAGRTVRERVEAPDGSKFCCGCLTVKTHEEWNRNKASRDGWSSYCKACTASRNRTSYFATKYGLSLDEIRDLFDKQPVCPICLKARPEHIDHDHVTGRVRGVLCFTCNAALGQLQDDPTIIRRAAAYVEGDVWQPTLVAPGVFRLPS